MAVNLSPVGGVAAQFFSNNGVPLAGGKIFTYAAGTTTPAATYTTSLGNVAWTNPIVLDAAGRVPGSGEIWLFDGTIYKFILKDSNDVLIATYDNITGINSNFVNFTTQQEIQTATAGQTVFDLTTMQYQPGTNSLTVYVDGVNQYGPGAQYAYLETDSDTVTFLSGLHVGASVKFTTATQVTGNATDASVVAYTPPFTGSVTTNVEDKLAQTFSVKDFGAVGDGVADDTDAIKDAIAAAVALTLSGNSGIFGAGVYVGTAPTINFPSGVYKVTAALTPDTAQSTNYLSFVGENAVIVADSGVTVFGGVGYMVNFQGLAFREGACAISIKTANADTTRINIVDCEFDEQTSAHIKTDNNSASTIVVIDRCKFTNLTSTAPCFYFDSGDQININNSWITANSPTYAIYSACLLQMTNVLGVPIGGMNTTGRWVENHGSLRCKNVRFGGEGGGAPICFQYSNVKDANAYPFIDSFTIFEDCELYSGGAARANGGVIVIPSSGGGLPSIVRVTGCVGNVDQYVITDPYAQLGSWLSSYESGSPEYATLSIESANNNFRSPGLCANKNVFKYAVAEFASQKLGNVLSLPTTVLGGNFLQTSTSSGVSIVDTAIYASTVDLGFSSGAVFDIAVSGDPNLAGSAAYRGVVLGTVAVTVGYSGVSGTAYKISYQENFNPSIPGPVSGLTVDAVFFASGVEVTTVLASDATAQIRIKVSGYTPTYEGVSQTVRLTRRV